MTERVEVYLVTSKSLIGGSIDSWGNLTVGRTTYVAVGGFKDSIVDRNGETVPIEHILVKIDDFEGFMNKLEAHDVQFSQLDY